MISSPYFFLLKLPWFPLLARHELNCGSAVVAQGYLDQAMKIDDDEPLVRSDKGIFQWKKLETNRVFTVCQYNHT